MLEKLQLGDILFLDIETVSCVDKFDSLSERMQALWRKKCRVVMRLPPGEVPEEDVVREVFSQRAGIFAEFGKIVCISVGYHNRRSDEFRLKSFASHDEKKLLSDFSDLLSTHFGDPHEHVICGHNIKEFDIPYLCRRMIIQQLALPPMLRIEGKKPWELSYLLDTMNLWKFGDFKSYTSLDLLAAVLQVPTPKDDIDGSQVGQVYYGEGDLARICTYCEKDVVTVAQVLMKLKGLSLIREDQIISTQ
ncbi:MAG: 3'-5' exonuclease [Saprospiraceae bacterium]|nr:3'-5' exonuclease [Saprospiraceae bacterium]